MMQKLKCGDRILVSGDSSELGLEDYNVRVSSEATVEMNQESSNQECILVTLDEVDGDRNVSVYVPISCCKEIY